MFKQTYFNIYNYCAKMFFFINIYILLEFQLLYIRYISFVLDNFNFRLINDFAICDSTSMNYKICTFQRICINLKSFEPVSKSDVQ